MLENDFPIHLGDRFESEGKNVFWVLSYDTNRDGEADIKVWFLAPATEQTRALTKIKRNPNPYKIQKFHIGVIVEEKIDYDLDGVADLHGQLINGYWTDTEYKKE